MKTRHLLFVSLMVVLFCAGLSALCFADTCPTCNGRGTVPCSRCGGRGAVDPVNCGGITGWHGCPNCNGVYGNPCDSSGGNSPSSGNGQMTCPTCRGTGQVGQSQSSTDNRSASSNDAAERQRQQEAAEQRKRYEEEKMREAEEAQRKHQEFERVKQDALRSMKGITENELGLKGISTNDDLGLKGIGETKADDLGLKGVGDSPPPAFVDSSVVDLRFLDPNKPITVDLNVVKGRARTIPVQPDPETFKNVSYNEGFADLLKFDPVSAVRHFEQAQKERPNDPVVRDALLLAQDLVNVHQQKEQDVKARTAHWTMQTYVTLMSGETGGALAFITRARDLNPNDKGIRVLAALTEKVARESNLANTPEKRAAYRLVGNGIVSVAKGDHAMAINYLEVARRLSPNDPYIANLLLQARNLETGRADTNKDKAKQRDSQEK